MNFDQGIVFAVLLITLGLFVWGRWRYDVVAMGALMTLTLAGVIPSDQVFSGFSHPAIITVATVLMISHALANSGAVDLLDKRLEPLRHHPTLQLVALAGLVAAASAFMNNVGALALFMPLALQQCRRGQRSPSEVLMPLSFASLLGGLVTLIGTPPTIVIANYRQELSGEPFLLLDFTPVGLAVATVGLAFIVTVGLRLLPKARQDDRQNNDSLFDIDAYITETRLPESSRLVGKPLRELERLGDADVAVVALVRGNRRILAPGPFELLMADDVIILEGHTSALKQLVSNAGLLIAGSSTVTADELNSERVAVVEAVVRPGAFVEGRSARMLNLHERFGINLLAMARQGQTIRQRISRVIFRAGDVLLLQGENRTLPYSLALLGCLPLARRHISLVQPRHIVPVAGIFALALLATATSWLAIHVAFTTAVLALILTGLLSLRDAYDSIDGPILVLLGAMIPVGQALENTGATGVLAGVLVDLGGNWPVGVILGLLIATTMVLSDTINNTATAVIMAPLAAGLALSLDLSADPFLMAVAIGSSCTFLTPIGHQSNTLVMGPGGYMFGDYWRMGLPLGLIVIAVAVPAILWFWPP
ncbi:MAG: SLC13 family permease [Candidatus Competibacterales bacterium]